MKRFRTLRGRLTALGVLAALGAVAVLTVAFNVALDRSLNADADNRARSLADAAVSTVTYADGRLRVHESAGDAALDKRVWIYEGPHVLERPTTSADAQREVDALVGRSRVFRDVPGADVRLYAAAVRAPDGQRQVGTVIAAQSLAAYDRSTDLALLGSLALAAVLLVAVGVLTWITVGRALDPVREMTASAADWSEHDPGTALRRDPTPATSWAISPGRSTRCWIAWRRACATSSACRPSSRTSCARRWRGSWPSSSCCNAASARPRSAARRTRSSRAALRR